jgi:hypothetical protein
MNENEILSALVDAGLSHRKAAEIVNRFDPDRISKQLHWLPYRNPKVPASLLISAIEQDYEPPSLLASELEGAERE